MEFKDSYDLPEVPASEDQELLAAILEKIELFGRDSEELMEFIDECGIPRTIAVSQ